MASQSPVASQLGARAQSWIQARPRVMDAMVVLASGVVSVVEGVSGSHRVDNWLWVGLAILVESLVLFWRRTHPAIVFAAVALTVSVAELAGHATPANGVVVAVFAAARYGTRRVALGVGAAAAGLHLLDQLGGSDTGDFWLGAAVLVLAWLLGDWFRLQSLRRVVLYERLDRLEFDRHQREHQAVLQERMRIARELHDIVSHSLSAMVMHAGGARIGPYETPQPVLDALRTIEETGRRELAEIRQLLGVLRQDDEQDAAPVPTVEQLDELIASHRQPDHTIHAEIGELPSLPSTVQLTTYRIVQESLTNVRRHSAATEIWVRIGVEGDDLIISVRDNGGAVSSGTGVAGAAPGFGLIGIRERVAIHGGTVRAGLVDDGFEVRANIPLTSLSQ